MKRQVEEKSAVAALPHPITGKTDYIIKESQLRTIVQISNFTVAQLLYLNGHFMAINLSTLTRKMLKLEAPPNRTENKTTTWQGIIGACSDPNRLTTRRGTATQAWHKSARAKFATKRSDKERRFLFMAIAANTSKFPLKATADMAIKQAAVINTEIVWCLLSWKVLSR